MGLSRWICTSIALATCLVATPGRAQFSGNAPPPAPLPVPNTGDAQQPTPQQVRDILMLRALQSRGRGRGVQRGAAQFVPFGGMGFGNPGGFSMPPQQPQQLQAGQAPLQNSDPAAQKRADREEKKRAAREKMREKREAAEKAKAEARAKARGEKVGSGPTDH